MTREQVRAARAVRGWGVRDLAQVAGLSFGAVTRYENGADARASTLDRLERALRAEGFEFLDGGRPGLRWDEGAPCRWKTGSLPGTGG